MTNYAGFEYPAVEVYQQTLTTSLDDGLDRWSEYAAADVWSDIVWPTLDVHNISVRVSHDEPGFVAPSYDTDLFGHILVVPARLDLGNLLSSQQRTLEIANLYLVPRSLEDIVNSAGAGITFTNLPSFPYTLPSFGSFVLHVSVSSSGPPTINGTIGVDTDGEDVDVPVTGTRITMFPWVPQVGIQEILEWKTEVLEAFDGTEQRISLRLTPRQRISMEIFELDPDQDALMRNVLFDWLPRVWGVPIWWEARGLDQEAIAGDSVLNVDTRYGDFRVGGLCMITDNSRHFESYEIDSLTDSTITITSLVASTFPAGTHCMPVRSAYAKTQAGAKRYAVGGERVSIEFLTIDNVDLGSTTGATIYDGKVVLDDPNFMDSSVTEGWSRPVTVLDAGSGVIYQASRVDRSRLTFVKTWEPQTMAETWSVRRLLHALRGSQRALWLPGFRADLRAVAAVTGGSNTLRVAYVGYTTFAQARRPQGDVRVVLANGDVHYRAVTDSDEDGATEVLTLSSAISAGTLQVSDIERIELLALVRIADDKATITHMHAGEARVETALISVKE
jgi:hypothetical protein